jgi:hypothetical protein
MGNVDVLITRCTTANRIDGTARLRVRTLAV